MAHRGRAEEVKAHLDVDEAAAQTKAQQHFDRARVIADRYGVALLDLERAVTPAEAEANRREYEAKQKAIAEHKARDVTQANVQRYGREEARFGANVAAVAAAIAAKVKPKPAEESPEAQAERRQREIEMARAQRYGVVVPLSKSDGPNATEEQIAKRPGAWQGR